MPVCLSQNGSDRATAYNISNKIVRRGAQLFVGWLDAPAEIGGAVRIRLSVCDGASGDPVDTFTLGQGIDNHCGPALVMDNNRRLHALIGAHHGNFLYRWSDTPEDEDSWSEPEPVGPLHSYPALAADTEGTLHVAYREKGERWQLHYTRKRPGEPWDEPTVIAVSPTPGYNHFMHGLTLGPTGNLHLTFQFHYSESGEARACKGKAAGYVVSPDGGDTWLHEDESVTLPLTTQNVRPFVSYLEQPHASLRIAPHTVDSHDRLWLFCAMEDNGQLWRRDPAGWDAIDLKAILPDLDLSIGKSSAISCDPYDNIHLLIATDPTAEAAGWYDPSLELFHLVFNSEGALTSRRQLTQTDPDHARWLPAIEHCDWLQPGVVGENGFWCLYTSGLNAGLMSQGDYNDILRNDVLLTRLGSV